MKKTIAVMIKIFHNLVFAALLAVALVFLWSRFSPGNLRMLVVESGSMEPALRIGSVVMVRPAPSYQTGDIITFQPAGAKVPTTHRISAVEEAGGRISYETKGDANDTPDIAAVPAERVLGKVIAHVPFLGYAVAAAKKPLGFLFIVVIPALLVIGDELMAMTGELRRRKRKPVEPAGLVIDLRN